MPEPTSFTPKKEISSPADLMENRIEVHYTHAILSGSLPPGSRLPSSQALARQWSTSCRTIQRAMASLMAAGLIERTASRGTFVRSREQQALVGVLMGPSLIDDSSGYYRNIWSSLQTELNSTYLSARIYDSLSDCYASPYRSTQISYLEQDCKFHNFVGLIEIATCGTALEAVPSGYPRALCVPKKEGNDVVHDYADAGRQIVEHFAREGARRFCILRSGPEPSSGNREVVAALQRAQEFGMPEPRVLDIPPEHESYAIEKAAHDAVLAAFSRQPRTKRPEGLFVTTDVAAKGAMLALLKLGVKVPQQMKVAVISSEKSRIYYSVPVQRYCLPIRSLASTLAAILHDRIAGRSRIETPVILKGWLEEERA